MQRTTFAPNDEAAAVEWPAPLARQAFHGPLGELATMLEPETEADVAALLIQALVLFGNIVGRGVHFVVGGTRHALNLYVALVGVTSKGRKGLSLDLMLQAFAELDPQLRSAQRMKSGLSSGEGLIWQVRDALNADDQGIEDKRLLVAEPELGRVLRSFQRDGNTLSPVLRQAWDTGCLSILTKGNGAVATDAHLSVIGHVTKAELTRYLDPTEIGSGFANRFLWVCVKRARLLPEGGQAVDLSCVQHRLREALTFADCLPETCSMERDAAARLLWAHVYPKLSAGRGGVWGAVTSRAEAQVARLACLYALADSSYFVTPAHLVAALDVWRYCDQSAAYIFGNSFGNPTADAIDQALLEAGPQGLTRTDISGQFSHNKSTRDLTEALNLLQELGRARKTERHGLGRPAECWVTTKETN